MSEEEIDLETLKKQIQQVERQVQNSKLQLTQLRKLHKLNQLTNREQTEKLKKSATNLHLEEDRLRTNFQKEKERRQQEIKIMKESLSDKKEKIQYLNEELGTLKETSSINQRKKNKQIEEVTRTLEAARKKTEQLEKENTRFSVKIEDAILDFTLQVEVMKEKIDDIIKEQAKKKKKKKVDKFLDEQLELIAMKLNSDQQKSQLEQLHNDYDSLSRMLNAKVNEFKTFKKSITRVEENIRSHKKEITELKEKIRSLKLKNREMNNAIDRGIVGVGAKLFESRINTLKKQLNRKEIKTQKLKEEIKELRNKLKISTNSTKDLNNNLSNKSKTNGNEKEQEKKKEEEKKKREKEKEKEQEIEKDNKKEQNVEERNARNLIDKLIESLADGLVNLKRLKIQNDLEPFQILLPKDFKTEFEEIKNDQKTIHKEILRLDSSIL
ncbi:centrosomal protein [Anaeramoeba flamelloides]|uniref:Centrosomal protein n=1 Tax=Anaeramoeba flamelloides TaxID=1746091 RepID=A0AAV7ZCD0_9EUKA|nr:centrosomal protein [Anaeramoeba flamelloides]KAJ6255322.1 centrosomal protein [Anaeramoeba flamelloides]